MRVFRFVGNKRKKNESKKYVKERALCPRHPCLPAAGCQTLEVGTCVWVLWGWHSIAIGLDDINVCLQIPLVNDKLFQMVSKKSRDQLVAVNVAALENVVPSLTDVAVGCRRWMSHAS